MHAEATAIDPAARTVATTGGSYGYDYLIVATGFRNKFDVVPGLGPDGYAQTITTLADAERAGEAWRKFLDAPGPVVIGATQGASCFGAAYEFLFNTSHQLRKAKLHDKVSLTFITSEPFVGHFGIGGLPGGEKLLNMFLMNCRRAAAGVVHPAAVPRRGRGLGEPHGRLRRRCPGRDHPRATEGPGPPGPDHPRGRRQPHHLGEHRGAGEAPAGSTGGGAG